MTITARFALRGDRSALLVQVLIAWMLLAPLIAVMNDYWPFSGAGDDNDYFVLATQFVRVWSDLADPNLFIGRMEQPAFPWMLGAINLAFDPGLLGLKYFNLMILNLVALVWYRIGCELATPVFGRWMMSFTLLLTPLWFYVLFLMKDLLVVLVQSLFLLGLARTWRSGAISGWLLAGVSALAILPLRAPLLAQNAAVALSVSGLRLLGPGHPVRRLLMAFIGLPLFLGLLALASNQSFMAAIGVSGEQRVISSEVMLEIGREYAEVSTMQRALFPLLYLFGETSGLNPESWQNFSPSLMRGLLAVPWIAFVVPSLLLGIRWLLVAPWSSNEFRVGKTISGPSPIRLLATPWAVIGIYVASSAAVSWVVGDTTRWRLSDMPALAAIAAAPWILGRQKQVFEVVILWIVVAAALFSGYYLWR